MRTSVCARLGPHMTLPNRCERNRHPTAIPHYPAAQLTPPQGTHQAHNIL